MRTFNYETQFAPYCADVQPDGRWLVLNRNYKALGTPSEHDAWQDHDLFRGFALREPMTMEQALSCVPDPSRVRTGVIGEIWRVYFRTGSCVVSKMTDKERAAFEARLEAFNALIAREE